MSDSAATKVLGCASLNTYVPMRIPNPSSITSDGTRSALVCSEMIGASTAATPMRARVGSAPSIIAFLRLS